MLNSLKKYSKWVTIFVLGVALIAVYKTFDSFSVILAALARVLDASKPFIFAFAIAYILNIPAKKTEGLLRKKVNITYVKKHAHGISVAIAFVLFAAFVFVMLSSLLPAIYKSLLDMADNIPKFVITTSDFVADINSYLEHFGISVDLSGLVTGVSGWFNSKAMSELAKYAQGLVSVTSGIVKVFIALIASVYMLLEKKHIVRALKRIVRLFAKREKSGMIIARFKVINEIFMQYLYSRFTCCIVMAVLSTLILTLMGAKYALLLGVFVGFMDLVPYFGSIISWVVSAIVMAISDGALSAVWCSVVMLVLQQFDGNILAPRVMGKRLEIRPLAIIIAVSVGGSLFGFVGMVISVPVVAIIKTITVEYMLTREKQIRLKHKSGNTENDD